MESIDPNDQIKRINSLIRELSQKQKLLQQGGSDFDENICVTIYSKYIKRLFTFRFAIEKQIQLRKEKHIFGLGDSKARENVLREQFMFSRFDFYIGVFSLFEDFVSSIVKSTLEEDEYNDLKPDIRKILEDAEIGFLVEKRFSKEYNEIKSRDAHIPLIRKVEKIQELKDDNYVEKISFFSTVRNILHSNGYYYGKEKEFKDFNKTFNDGELVEFSMNELMEWSEAIFKITYVLSDNYLSELINDRTLSV